MKPLLGTEKFKNEEAQLKTEKPFFAARVEESTAKALSEALDRHSALLQKGNPSCLMQGLFGFFTLLTFAAVVGQVSEWMSEGVDPDNLLAPLIVIVYFAGISVLLWWLMRDRKKKALRDPNLQQAQAEVNRLFREVWVQLGIPDNAGTVDALVFDYRMVNGEVRPLIPKNGRLIYKNQGMKFWSADDVLYVSNLLEKYAIPMNRLQGIRTLTGKFELREWHKSEPVTAPAYEPYDLFEDEEHHVQTKVIHVLEFEYEGENWGIWFPNYELPALEQLTGMKA